MSVTRKRRLARTFFLGVTAVAIGTECWFAWDGDPETDPWTDLIGDYVPWQVTLAVFGALLLWLPAHFYVRYKRELLDYEIEAQKNLRQIRQANEVIAMKDRHIADLKAERIDLDLTDPDQPTLF